MDVADRLAISMKTMQTVDFPHQGLLDVTDLRGNNLQLAVRDVAALAAEVHHHDVPPLVPVILPPVLLKLLKSLLSVVGVNGEIVQSLAVAVVEFVNPLDVALQILNSFLNLNDGDIQSTMVDSLIFESGLDRQHLLLEFPDLHVLASELLPL